MPTSGMIKYSVAIALGFGLSVKAIDTYLNRTTQYKESEVLNEVLFFPDSEFPCKKILNLKMIKHPDPRAGCVNPSCRRLHGRPGEPPSSFIKFLTYLGKSKSRIDLCIFMFTQVALADLLRDLHRSGIRIRIITDSGEDEATASQLLKLSKSGIQVKSNKKGTGALMHHKYVLVDDKILLTGSFNWTNKAVVSNHEAVVVTTMESLVKPFVQEFQSMWTKFSMHKTNC